MNDPSKPALFSAVPSLNDVPDPSWAAWGSDPSTIKKEEEQVKRPTATYVKVEDVISNTGRNRTTHNAGHPHPAAHPTASNERYGNAPRSAQRLGTASPPGARHPRYPVRLPPPSFGQQANSTSQSPNTGLNDSRISMRPPQIQNSASLSMRPPQIPVTYAKRPTFQYNANTEASSPIITPHASAALLRIDASAPIQSQDRAQAEVKATSIAPHQSNPRADSLHQPTPTAGTSHQTTSTASNGCLNVSPSPISDLKAVSDLKGRQTQRSYNHAASNMNASTSTTHHSDTQDVSLERSSGADSGHAIFEAELSKSNVSSTKSQITLLPNITQQETVSNTTAKKEGKEQEVATVNPLPSSFDSSSIKQFKINLPENLSIPKSLRIIDYNELRFLANENEINLDIDTFEKAVILHLKNDTVPNRKYVCFLIKIVLDALRKACPGEIIEISDLATRNLLLQINEQDKGSSLLEAQSLPLGTEDTTVAAHGLDGIPSPGHLRVTARQAMESESAGITPPVHLTQQSTSPRKSLLALLHDAQSKSGSSDALQALLQSKGEQPPVQSGNDNVKISADSPLEKSPSDLKRLLDNAITVPHGSLLPQQASTTPSDGRLTIPSTPAPVDEVESPVPSSFNVSAHVGQAQKTDTTKQVIEKSQAFPTENLNEDDLESGTWISESTRPGIKYEIRLPLPDDLVFKTGRKCDLESQIPIERTDWIRSRSSYYLRDDNRENLLLARKVLLVIIYLIQPSFLPSEPILLLKKGTPEYNLVKELSQDKDFIFRKARMNDLAGHIISRLRDHPHTAATQVMANAIDNIVKTPNDEPSSAPNIPGHLTEREYATQVDDSLGPSVDNLAISAIEQNVPREFEGFDSQVAREKGSLDNGSSEKGSSAQSQAEKLQNLAELGIEDLQGILTPHNSLSWYLPEGQGRKRFVGHADTYVKTIRQAVNIPDIFWKLFNQQDDSWFIFLIGSYQSNMNNRQKENLAYAFRLCKSWAIAVYAPNMLPVLEDLPTQYREDPLFRLDEVEVSIALTISQALRNVTPAQQEQSYKNALFDLIDICKRPRVRLPSTFRPLHLQSLWPGVFSGLCTEFNSISWTITGLQEVSQFCGPGFSNLSMIKKITGVGAVKFDSNERRYGHNNCRVYLLGSMEVASTELEEICLFRTFRLIIAATKSHGFDRLLPNETNMYQSKLAQKALLLAREDEDKLDAFSAVSPGMNISYDSLRAMYTHLRLDIEGTSSSSSQYRTTLQKVPEVSHNVSTVGSASSSMSTYNHYMTIRDIPEYSLMQPALDDGYMTPSDEEIFQETPIVWHNLKYGEKMALIGSASWAVETLEDIMSAYQSSVYEAMSIGPSASQVGSASSDSTISHGREEPDLPDRIEWQKAREPGNVSPGKYKSGQSVYRQKS